ncbi:3-oxoacyl-ACP synthase III family protein [Halalkalibacterium halodurans]|uniref:3-oxoacyl-[acyl-carrier-protein] synthase III n=1 Tax=Halalkalibacterium halodurans (strain ATCC BAA-125 / DSM 18197 / FERM 7344 / JCM 9153 / C-125) TaxID=272558 RepID=Q9KBT0_HALH5|nr:3-oxoacyl-ACP synthase III family protein [Halalkalibacterium halodurans]MDY7222404.1 3-oxoacyl-ACP synthase III family protein [Halalkalibacterium halodurans]MDY7241625.1 3-oxoacyl-ACP synthase III family protein [Halalkalibacterium halodurans]MED4082289.1 3-oxoacyl-ACP synthase III family protein [Halalkalibacterium halodurans]MED4083560.1 3-oxoacyl-ACP synthase III family protein [Halalkalibacterium halodurans]MED4105873.1 3-oxoacyl-ACP synthase III family protein [Halalkalibacterium hal
MLVQELKPESKATVSPRIIGFGECLPGEPVTNEQMEQLLSIRKEWLETMIGNRSRHFAVNFSSRTIDYGLADLCTEAAVEAIDDAGINAEELDLIVLSTATPDHLMPATVNIVADRLGLERVKTYQIQAGCSGALQALDVARHMLVGSHRYALVIGGDVCNKYMDLSRDFSKLRSSELINYALFGDGAGAVVLTNENQDGLQISYIENRFEGKGRAPGQIMNWFGTVPENVQELSKRELRKQFQSAKEDYKAIEQHVPIMTEQAIEELLGQMKWTKEEVSYYLPPQLGWNMTKKIIDLLGLPLDSTINCVQETGNNGNALPYLQLKRLNGILKPNDKVVGVAIESSKWMKTGITLEYKKGEALDGTRDS